MEWYGCGEGGEVVKLGGSIVESFVGFVGVFGFCFEGSGELSKVFGLGNVLLCVGGIMEDE